MSDSVRVVLASGDSGALLVAVFSFVVYLYLGFPFSLAVPIGAAVAVTLHRRVKWMRGDAPRLPKLKVPHGLYDFNAVEQRNQKVLSSHKLRFDAARQRARAFKGTPELQLRVATLTGIRNAVLYVAAGIGLVGAVQAVAVYSDDRLHESVDAYERTLLEAKQFLDRITLSSTWVLLLVLTGLVALTIRFPRLRLVPVVLRYRKLASNGLVVVTTASAFTFMASGTVSLRREAWAKELSEHADARWVVERRARLDDLRRQRDEDGPRTVAAVLLREEVANADDARKKVLVEAVKSALKGDGRRAARALVRESPPRRTPSESLAGALSPPKAPELPREGVDPSIAKVDRWLGPRSDELSDIPPKSSVQAFIRDAKACHAAREDAEKALVDVLTDAIGNLVPGGEIPKAFVEETIDAVVERTLSDAKPGAVRAIATASLWVSLQRDPIFVRKWEPPVEVREPRRPDSPSKPVDPALAALMERWGENRSTSKLERPRIREKDPKDYPDLTPEWPKPEPLLRPIERPQPPSTVTPERRPPEPPRKPVEPVRPHPIFIP
jgi:hypothetical protein